MLTLIVLLYIMGLSLYLVIDTKPKMSRIIIFPLLMAIGVHSFLFLFLGYLHIFYNNVLFLWITGIVSVLCVAKLIIKKEKRNITNDLKQIPIYYILFLLYLGYRFVLITSSTFINFNNWDELRVYQYVSKAIVVSKDVNYMYFLFAPMTYVLGTLSYSFTNFSLSNPRIFGSIFYILSSLFIYFELRTHRVNRHISALVSMLFLLSSGENFLYYITFYNNVYYALFLLIGLYLYISYKTKETPAKSEGILAFLFLISACITRRESPYHIMGIILCVNLYFLFKKRGSIKKMIFEILPFICIFLSWNLMYKINIDNIPIARAGKYGNPVSSAPVFENLTSRLNIQNMVTFFKASLEGMFENGFASNNQMIFIIPILVLFLAFYFLIKRKKTEKLEFAFFCILAQFLYYGIVLLTALCLFNKTEFEGAASFTRYMMMVLPISFIAFGILLFSEKEEEKKPRKIENHITKKSKILLIIPAYNEEKNIKNTYDKIIAFNRKNKTNYDCLVINDGSVDKTAEILDRNNIPHVDLIHNLGIGGAVQTGYKYAYENNYDIAIQYDGDGQHDVAYVEKLIEPLRKNEADLVIGSRFLEKESEGFKSSVARRIGIKLISIVIKQKTNKKIYDTTSGFRAINKDLIALYTNHYPTEYPEPISNVDAIKQGYKIKEVSVKMQERQEGVSSINTWKSAYYMINVILTILLMEGDRES